MTRLIFSLIASAAISAVPLIVSADAQVRRGTSTMRYTPVGFLIKDQSFICTATMIGPSTVLTAAHCFEAQRVNRDVRRYSTFFHIAGIGQALDIVTYCDEHACSTSEERDLNDLAVITLATPMRSPFTVSLGSPSDWAVGDSAQIVGFGSAGVGTPVPIKREGTVEIGACDAGYPVDTVICFRYGVNEAGPGGNDSGGPMLVYSGLDPAAIGVLDRAGANAGEARYVDVSTERFRNWVLAKRGNGSIDDVVTMLEDSSENPLAAGDVDAHEFVVPMNTERLSVTVNHSSGSRLSLSLSQLATCSYAAMTAVCTVDSPAPGRWVAFVKGEQGESVYQIVMAGVGRDEPPV